MTTPVSATPMKGLHSVASNTKAPQHGTPFAEVLERARNGGTISGAEQCAWAQWKTNQASINSLPDEIEMAGMVNGFKMEFPEGFPSDLRSRLEKLYESCKTPQEKYDFVRMHAGSFDPTIDKISGYSWGTDWQTRLRFTIEANDAIAISLNNNGALGTRRSNALLKQLLQ